MRMINGVPTNLEARDGETITVTVNGVARPPNVLLTLDGAPWSGGSFTVLEAANPGGRHLLVQIECGPTPGKTFEIVLSGDATIDPETQVSQFPITCRQGPLRQVSYTIDVV